MKSPNGSTSSVDSSVDVSQTTAVYSPTSPSRSPRMANLLSALQDIIGPDLHESTESSASVEEKHLCDTSDATHLPDAVEGTGAAHDENMRHVHGQEGDASNRSEPQNGLDIMESARDFNDETSTAGDSGTPEDEIHLSSPVGLLSPVQIGTVPPLPFPHVGLDAALAYDDSFGSAEAWVGPTQFSLSPPHLSQPGSTLDLLSSPFGSPVSRILPRRPSSSASWKQSGLPTLRDSIDTVPPPSISTIISQHNMPSAQNSRLIPASHAWHSPLHSFPPEHKRVGHAISSDGMANESDLSIDVSNSSMTFHENAVNTRFVITTIPNTNSTFDQVEYLPVHGGMVGRSQVPIQLSSTEVEVNQPEEPSPHPTSTVDIKATSAHSTSEDSPVSPGTIVEVREFDYEALYQSFVMSPEGAASKHMSWASCSSPPRTSSVGTLSLPGSTVVHANVLRRSHSSVDLLRLPAATALLFESTSCASIPLLETPVSDSNKANASTQSIQVRTSPPPLSATVVATSPLTPPRLPAEKSPQHTPIAEHSRDIKPSLNDHHKPEPARIVWNSVSTSRKVPFGFRNSVTVR